ncbi:anaphase-promoting complex subunit 10-like [Clytia hemisphaerica]|uniref:Anaphase-promoting complex subunit 10 n=1 Tax=Clytia hemisphaerica TaxID=252671 RepID=A0A7M5X0F3_9CNID
MSDTKSKKYIQVEDVFPEETALLVREIGQNAVWSLSSCKVGSGVNQLRDNDLTTYWQSDGPQPHLINIQFPKRTIISYISIYTEYKQDESYTPNKISIRVGNDPHDLQQFELLELDEPSGWINTELCKDNQNIKTFMIQIAVLGNHQNGRDTHLRQIKIFGPKHNTVDVKVPSIEQFVSVDMAQFSCIR